MASPPAIEPAPGEPGGDRVAVPHGTEIVEGARAAVRGVPGEVTRA